MLCAGLFFVPSTLQSQVLKNMRDKAKQKVNQRVNNKVDKAMDKTLDEAEAETKIKKDGDGDTKKKIEDSIKIKKDAGGDVKVKHQDGTKEKLNALTFSSKYDFVPGEKVVGYEDFSGTEIGDFPERWNTNATAEVVTINLKEGKWLKINKEGVWMPEFITTIPDNATLEFDLGINNGFDGSNFVLNIANLKSRDKDFTDFYHYVSWKHGHALHMQFKPFNGRSSANAKIQTATDGNYIVNNDVDFKGWDNEKNSFAHFALWRQKDRLRVYINGEKVFDIPKAFATGGKYNAITFAMQGSYNEADYYLLSNIRMAIGAADTRNKLITEGKFVTRGILFDVNSDRIKPESAGALKDIATVLKENSEIKVKIVGHTDGDGDEKTNLSLSEKRAAAVKNYLVKTHDISESNLITEGKGETQPVDKNTTVEGKANNRRVEFIKQ